MKQFEDSLAWQKSKSLSTSIYKLFRSQRDFGFRDQICRAAVSIMNNIAEGYERGSQKELRQFLYIAKGSCGEVRSMLNLAKELDYLTDTEYETAHKQAIEVSKLISGFIKNLTF